MVQNIKDNRPSVSKDYIAALLQFANDQGLNTGHLLSTGNLSKDDFDNSDIYVTVNQHRKIFQKIMKQLKDPALGLHFGMTQHASVHGALGLAIISSSNVREALKMASRFIKTRLRQASLEIINHDDMTFSLIFHLSMPVDELYLFLIEQAFSSFIYITKFLVGDFEYSVKFNYPEPDYSDEYRKIFKNKIVFNADLNQIQLPVHLLQRSIAIGDSAIVKIAEKQCENQMGLIDDNSNLELQIRTMLMNLQGCFPNRENMARQLGLSRRTLTRRLQALGTTFQDILNSVRHELAVHYLKTTRWSIEEITYMLGYESASNFGRAFKRWTGKAPGEYRNGLKDLEETRTELRSPIPISLKTARMFE